MGLPREAVHSACQHRTTEAGSKPAPLQHLEVVEVVATHRYADQAMLVMGQTGCEELGQPYQAAAVDDIGASAPWHVPTQTLRVVMSVEEHDGQVMFRGGPSKSPGWIRERIAWSNGQDSENVHGPCTFGD